MMKLAKALKVKNRLAGEIALAQKLIAASNVVEEDNKQQHDLEELYRDLVAKQEQLAALKANIAIANGPISEKIFMLSELKARIAFLRSLDTKDGKFVVEGRYGSTPMAREYHAHFDAAWVEGQARMLSGVIEQLQDTIDEFNATTEI